MLEIFDQVEQNSPEWHELRCGIPTASSFSDVMAGGKGITRAKYLRTLAAERVTETVSDGYSNHSMARGHEYEPRARDLYAFMTDETIRQIGFMRQVDDETGVPVAGASPDALIGDDGLLEIKTKLPHLVVEVLERGACPAEHVKQIQGQLWISGRQWCDLVCYNPNIHAIIRVERDEKVIEEIAEAVRIFNNDLAALERLIRRRIAA